MKGGLSRLRSYTHTHTQLGYRCNLNGTAEIFYTDFIQRATGNDWWYKNVRQGGLRIKKKKSVRESGSSCCGSIAAKLLLLSCSSFIVSLCCCCRLYDQRDILKELSSVPLFVNICIRVLSWSRRPGAIWIVMKRKRTNRLVKKPPNLARLSSLKAPHRCLLMTEKMIGPTWPVSASIIHSVDFFYSSGGFGQP